MLVCVVGPSGAGKDTLLNEARQALAGDQRFRFVRRVITRPAGVGAEDHDAVTDAEFRRRRFALQWQAHGFSYGIPADIADTLGQRRMAVASVSRSVIGAAAAGFPTRVIEVTAPPDILAKRLIDRKREGAVDVAQRLARHVAIPREVEVKTIVNDGTIEEGGRRFLAALLGMADFL